MELDALFTFLLQQPLLLLALAAIFIAVVGQMLHGAAPRLAKGLRFTGNLGLLAALLLTVAQAARMTGNSDFSLTFAGLKPQRVEGGETRIPMGADNHFWLTATVNGVQSRFLVDTGASLTALSEATARAAGVTPGPLSRTLIMRTANGDAPARTVSIADIRFGNIAAQDLDAVIAPGIGDTNVIGMNLLTRLASWRVEGRTLILVPNPAPPAG